MNMYKFGILNVQFNYYFKGYRINIILEIYKCVFRLDLKVATLLQMRIVLANLFQRAGTTLQKASDSFVL